MDNIAFTREVMNVLDMYPASDDEHKRLRNIWDASAKKFTSEIERPFFGHYEIAELIATGVERAFKSGRDIQHLDNLSKLVGLAEVFIDDSKNPDNMELMLLLMVYSKLCPIGHKNEEVQEALETFRKMYSHTTNGVPGYLYNVEGWVYGRLDPKESPLNLSVVYATGEEEDKSAEKQVRDWFDRINLDHTRPRSFIGQGKV